MKANGISLRSLHLVLATVVGGRLFILLTLEQLSEHLKLSHRRI